MGVIERVVDRLVASTVPLEREPLLAAARELLAEEAPLADATVAAAAVDALIGLGPIEVLLRDPEVSDVLVNAPDDVWVERAGRMERAAVGFPDEQAVRAAVERVVTRRGLRIDRAAPAVDARLGDGSRLHAVFPPAAVDGPVVAVRRFVPRVRSLDDLVAVGAVAEDGASLLRRLVRDRATLLVSGGTGSGKTTLLNVLSTEIDPAERVVTVEDAAELQLSGHRVRLEARPANTEGAGEITLRELLRHALRLRPDRIVVGEVRGPEALDMIQAMSTGHDGSMSTVHASSPEEALWRLETLALSGAEGVSEVTVRRLLHSGIDAVIHTARGPVGRRIESIGRVGASGVEELLRC